PRFLDEHLRGVILAKAYAGDSQAWYEHFSFIKDMLTFNWLWSPFMVWGLWLLAKRVRRDHSVALYLLLWALTLPMIMSAMRTHYVWFLMQVFPALALAAALAMSEIFSQYHRDKLTKGFIIAGTAAIILVNALPFPLDRDREKDTRILAPYVKHFAESGAKVIALREDFYGLNNALLFFSDHAANPLYSNAAEMAPDFSSKGLVLCVAHHSDLQDLQTLKGWYPVKYGEDMILIANQKLDTADVKTDILN
ncbi:MAG TPA: hypothetical protein VIJ93_14755, partial [bacterium]